MTQQNIDIQSAQTRLLLALWDMNGLELAVKKSDLTKRVMKSRERAGDYTPCLDVLAERGSILLTNKAGMAIAQTTKIGTFILLTEAGMLTLKAGLADQSFQFGGQQVGSRVANALLKWIREVGSVTKINDVAIAPKISTYDEFKSVALETYEQLNRDYNLSNLVPIYQIRRAIADRVTRLQFNDWMLKMQANDILQFITGGVADLTPDKEFDSIMTELGGLRYYAKLL